jgi:hypothetical protein
MMQEIIGKRMQERPVSVWESIREINIDSCSRYLKSTLTQHWNLSFVALLEPSVGITL